MKTLVIGASTNLDRYSYKAITSLVHQQHQVVAIGNKAGIVSGIQFSTELEPFTDVDTVTLYINPTIQQKYYDYIIGLQPRRVIFNPGTENEEFAALLYKHNIDTIEACTLVMLSIGVY